MRYVMQLSFIWKERKERKKEKKKERNKQTNKQRKKRALPVILHQIRLNAQTTVFTHSD